MKAGQGGVDPLQLRDSTVLEWRQTTCIKKPLASHLIVHLKRFDNAGTKIDSFLEFPEDKKVVIKDENNDLTTYEIIAYVNHHGESSKKGHYTATVKNFRDEPGKER